MFAIYNTQGRAFRDSLEALKQIRQPHAVREPLIQADVYQDETLAIQGIRAEEASANAKSIATYRKMLHANERTVIVHAYQLMTHPVKTIYSSATVADAYQEFAQHKVNQFPVVSPQLELIGMINRTEIIDANYQTPDKTLAEIIDNEIITADPVSDIRRVATVLHEYQLGALPIVNEQDHLVGIISKTDILKALMNEPPISLWT